MKKALLSVSGLALIITVSACGARPMNGQASPDKPTEAAESAAPIQSSTLFGDAQEMARTVSMKTGEKQSTKVLLTQPVGQDTNSMEGTGRFGDDPAVDLTMTADGSQLELRFVNHTVYVKTDGATTGGKPWGQIPADHSDEIRWAVDQEDPNKILDRVQQAGTMTKSERTTLNGQPVSHYWVNIGFDKAADWFSGISGYSVEELRGFLPEGFSIPMELWLDQDSLPVQITEEDPSPIMRAADDPEGDQPSTITIEYSDWGTPVAVEAPPADQVSELTDLPE